MNLKKIGFLIFSLFCFLDIQAQVQSPESFFPHKFGESFTPYHLLIDYAEHLAAVSDHILIEEYGRTNELRPLVALFISSPENIEKLEQIRLCNLTRAGLLKDTGLESDINICWLSFGVHGNEAGGPESSIAVMNALADTSNHEIQGWLKNTLVILDPCINPDGYSRYTHWVNGVSQKANNPNPFDREHHEPWPGGRVNHYLFDLNRDWAWQTQMESQARLALYNKWMPQIHVDIHEMEYNSSYYFAPAAQPYHTFITDWQSEFQVDIGKHHAGYFDKAGWLYFTREVFDLFYPSYGDTYPTFNGAIGMTYEQGGHSDAGRQIQMENGNLLNLSDRIEHHKTTALSTIEMASMHSKELIEEFERYFKSAVPGKYKSYVISAEKHSGRLAEICAFFDRQQIQYSTLAEPQKLKGFRYSSRKTEEFQAKPGDLVIQTDQSKRVLLSVLMDPEAVLTDSLTYDITAWSIPYAYGMEAYALTQLLDKVEDFSAPRRIMRGMVKDGYAYAFKTDDLSGQRLLASLLKIGLKPRVSHTPLSISGEVFEQGTVFMLKADHSGIAGWSEQLISKSSDENVHLQLLSTGFSDAGVDLGSEKVKVINTPKVLLVSGEQVNPYAFGQVWHYFENVLHYPLTIAEKDRIFGSELNSFNLIIIPEAYYSFSDSEKEQLSDWVGNGGKLIIMGSSLSNFADGEYFELKRYTDETEANEAKANERKRQLEYRFHDYADAERIQISDMMPGAIVKTDFDHTHPLGFGQEESYFSLKTSSNCFALLTSGNNVAYVPKKAEYIGFVGSNVKEKLAETLVFGVERKGSGQVIYMVDNPLFRGFWSNGLLVFGNAVFY
jgi:hypothetical protein